MTPWIFADLNRPQYPPTPDVVQSALAWSFFQAKAAEKPQGFVYFRQSTAQAKRLLLVKTRPDSEHGADWIAALRKNNLLGEHSTSDSELARATAESLIGVEPEKGTGLTAAPLGLAASLLQDPSGAMGVANPPNFAALINQIFQLGAQRRSGDAPKKLASEHWLIAIRKLTDRNRVLSRIDAALFDAVIHKNLLEGEKIAWPAGELFPNEQSKPGPFPSWWTSGELDPGETPFGWFADSWQKLCSDEWIDALPPRRWTDWASCLIRQALAFCFLWEAHFLAELSRYVVKKDATLETALSSIRMPPLGLIPWSTAGAISSLDVKPRLRELLRCGHACRAALWNWQKEAQVPSIGTLSDLLKYVKKNASDELREKLNAAIFQSAEAGGLRNLIETVEYSLLCRRETGRSADFYGFTKTVSRRFTHVSPSPEWIVVISSMAAPGPMIEIRLSDVLVSLQRLGLQPRIDTLVRELERAGLCASAPDGDEGIVISPAFGG